MKEVKQTENGGRKMTLEEKLNITENRLDFHRRRWLRKSVYQDKPLQSGKMEFPKQRILRNNLCLPACKQKNIATKLRDTA